jgi:hypothetical protein
MHTVNAHIHTEIAKNIHMKHIYAIPINTKTMITTHKINR